MRHSGPRRHARTGDYFTYGAGDTPGTGDSAADSRPGDGNCADNHCRPADRHSDIRANVAANASADCDRGSGNRQPGPPGRRLQPDPCGRGPNAWLGAD